MAVPPLTRGHNIRRQHPGLTLEAGGAIWVVRQMGHHGFDRDLAIEARVSGEGELAHAAAADFTFDLE